MTQKSGFTFSSQHSGLTFTLTLVFGLFNQAFTIAIAQDGTPYKSTPEYSKFVQKTKKLSDSDLKISKYLQAFFKRMTCNTSKDFIKSIKSLEELPYINVIPKYIGSNYSNHYDKLEYSPSKDMTWVEDLTVALSGAVTESFLFFSGSAFYSAADEVGNWKIQLDNFASGRDSMTPDQKEDIEIKKAIKYKFLYRSSNAFKKDLQDSNSYCQIFTSKLAVVENELNSRSTKNKTVTADNSLKQINQRSWVAKALPAPTSKFGTQKATANRAE